MNNLYLGLSIEINELGLFVSQIKYIDKIIDSYDLSNALPVKSPAVLSQHLDDCEDSPLCVKEDYQSIIGSLLYLVSGTRPDISFSVINLSRFSSCPREIHMKAARRVAKYVKTTKSYKLFFPRGDRNSLVGYSDATWSVTKDGKGFSGHMIKLFGSVICWKTSKQKIVALSSAESELLAMVECVRDLKWVVEILTELGVGDSEMGSLPLKLYTDSQSVIDMVYSLACSTRSKHYARKVWFIRDEIEKGLLVLLHQRSNVLVADLLTRASSSDKLIEFMGKLGLVLSD